MRRIVSAIMLILLVGILTLTSNVKIVKAYYYYNFTITVIPESPTPQSKVNVTVSLETACINYVVNFSTRSQSGNDFSITIDIYVPLIEQPMIGWAAETYKLGKLLADTYSFNAEVRVWDYTGFLSELLYYGKSFTVAYAITVPDDYPTIQEAINNANEGDSIFVRNGTYYENVVVNKRLRLIGDGSEVTRVIAADSTKHAVHVVSNDVVISGFQISGATFSEYPWASDIYLDGVNGTQLLANSVVNNYFGIWLEYSNNNSIMENTVCFNYWGIHIDYESSSNTVHGNNASFNDWYGITINRSSNHTIVSDNIASSNRIGISIGYSDYGTFTKNQIYNNSWYGIQIQFPSHHNRFYGNNIGLNTKGISFNAIGLSYNNSFYHNDFMDNHFDTDVYGQSDWDLNSEGNYWSDYEENYPNASFNEFGIWDTPYVIDDNNQDNYPLLNPYWNPADINHDLKVDIYDVVLVCSAYTSTPSDPHWNCHCDIAEPYGIIDIFDIVMIAGSYGEEYNP